MGLNFRGWSHPRKLAATKILPPWQFARWKDGCWVQKKAMHVWTPCLQRHMGSCCWRNASLHKRAKDRYAVAGGNYLWWQNFMGLIFMVEGTHKNFHTMKISAYTVYMCYSWPIQCMCVTCTDPWHCHWMTHDVRIRVESSHDDCKPIHHNPLPEVAEQILKILKGY